MKPLTESVLQRLTGQALATYFEQAQSFELAMQPGCCLAFAGEPVADLNYLVAGVRASEGGHFATACTSGISRGLPFLAIVFPEAGPSVERTANDLGLIHVADFPFMVREDGPIEPEGNDSVIVRRASDGADAEANVTVLSSAFGMPEESVRRAAPASLGDSPNVDIFLASIDDAVVGTVTLIHQGDTSAVWSMATDTARQRSGIGRRLLSTAMADAQVRGAARFYLGATAAGYPLYESLDFTTRTTTKVWASGETHQA